MVTTDRSKLQRRLPRSPAAVREAALQLREGPRAELPKVDGREEHEEHDLHVTQDRGRHWGERHLSYLLSSI